MSTTLEPQLLGYPDVALERDVECRLPDGVILRADVYRPFAEGVAPVLLMRLPYDKTTAGANWGYAHPAWYASHGYVVVAQDVRGRFASEGEFTPFAPEAADGYESVEWAARLPGSNGAVGMYGFSYPGATQLLAASTRPPSLRAIVPGFTSSQFYDGWTYAGGALSLALVAGWASFLALDTARRRGDADAHAGLLGGLGAAPASLLEPAAARLPLRARHPRPLLPRLARAFDRTTTTGGRPPLDEDFSRITVPALHLGGWYDIFITRDGAELHRDPRRRRPGRGSAKAPDRALAALSVEGNRCAGAQRPRPERRRRLAGPLLRRGPQGRVDGGLRLARCGST